MPHARPILLVALVLACPVTAREKFAPTKAVKALLDLVNKERASAGLPPLVLNEKLTRSARAHSANMARQGVLGHTLDGKAPGDRLQDVGYRWATCGENCAQGQRSPTEAVRC